MYGCHEGCNHAPCHYVGCTLPHAGKSTWQRHLPTSLPYRTTILRAVVLPKIAATLMSVRRAHPKSKLGCADCKRRRIKCDEGRPECINCQKRGLQCSFQTFDPTPQYTLVLHGILAVGCLHLSTAAGMELKKDSYQDTAATEMNMGMAQYHTEVQKVTTNAEALFAFSAMVTTFVLFTTANECNETLQPLGGTVVSIEHHNRIVFTMTQLICRTFRSMRGVLVILVPCYHHIRSGKLEPMLERDWWPAPMVVSSEDFEIDRKLRRLEMMWSQPGKTYEYSFDALRSALKDLRENFAVVSRLRDVTFPGDGPDEHTFDWTAVLHWPVQLSLDFISLLEQQRMEAWVLMAHYAMLPAKATINPWLDGFGTNIVTTTALAIGEDNWEWIAWPATVLQVDLERLRIQETASSRD